MREKILTFIEKNSRINLKELAIMLGVDEASVANEIAAMEQENVICGYHTLIHRACVSNKWYTFFMGKFWNRRIAETA